VYALYGGETYRRRLPVESINAGPRSNGDDKSGEDGKEGDDVLSLRRIKIISPRATCSRGCAVPSVAPQFVFEIFGRI
jgi:hypothetical protein